MRDSALTVCSFYNIIIDLFLLPGACEAYPGPDGDVSSGERPGFVQHSHHQTLRRGELIIKVTWSHKNVKTESLLLETIEMN